MRAMQRLIIVYTLYQARSTHGFAAQSHARGIRSLVVMSDTTMNLKDFNVLDTADIRRDESAVPNPIELEIATTQPEAVKPQLDTEKYLALARRRLITKQDSFHLHKIFGTAYLLSSTAILITALVNNLAGTTELPLFLEPVLQVMSVSGLVVTGSAIRLAVIHRRAEVHVRNVFLSASISSLFNVYVAFWSSPFAPGFLMDDAVTRFCFAAFAIAGVAGVVDIVATADDVVQSKQRLKHGVAHMDTAHYLWDYFNYISPTLWGLPFFIIVGWMFAVEHDRQWYVDICSMHPGMMAQAVYANVAASAANNWSVFAVTLRDKKLIDKNLEMLIISAVSLSALTYNAVILSQFHAAAQSFMAM